MERQMTIFDYMPTIQQEPEIGEWVETHGAVICGCMRRSYIGEKVVMDKSTSSHEWYKVGILEDVKTGYYYRGDQKVECDIAIVYDGSRQRNIYQIFPGHEIYECLPWNAYPKRMAAIGAKQ